MTLFLLNEYDHFSAENDTDTQPQIDIVRLGWTEDNFSAVSSATIRKTFEGYDFLIGTDYAAAFCNKANIQLDIYYPAGTDLYDWPFKRPGRLIPHRWQYNITLCSLAQFYGIRQATHLAIDPTNDDYEARIMKIRGHIRHIENIPYHYLPFFIEEKISIPGAIEESLEAMQKFNFKIVYHGRQEWVKGEVDIHYKGNDRLINGFHLFLKNTDASACLVLLEYGSDVAATKQLISELNLQDKVIWLPKMPRKYLFRVLRRCTMGVGIFGKSWVSSCAIYELLMAGLPVIGHRSDEDYPGIDLYPIYNANSAAGIATLFNQCYNNQADLQTMGETGFKWIERKTQIRIKGVLQAIEEKENTGKSFIKALYTYPYYRIPYTVLKPLSWFVEFFSTRLKQQGA